ncbi:zinc finger CCCH-type with G patch domain-containing protein-like [Diadema antillarum]|uniref:zinc finger CCCH-type with G patch domain-containing protein-like n=1 Tax=Diadema antillarum TaxID=105358 RepID=UPI003A83779C
MDEATLEATIAAYKQQLQQVEAICQNASGEEAANLTQLQNDLREVIELTQGSLLSLKKSELLSYVDDITTKPATTTNSHTCKGRENEDPPLSNSMDEEFAAFQAAIADEGSSRPASPVHTECNPNAVHRWEKSDYKREDEETPDNDSDDDDDDKEEDEEEEDRRLSDITGTKCSIVYRHEWGAQQRHNAVVLSVEPSRAKDDEVRVRVLFCNPTNAAMKPCPFFFKGECRFTEEDCRFSHGFSVKVTDLKSFQEVDLSCLSIEARCLAKYTDDIWYPAEVIDIDTEAERITVCFESYGDSKTLGVKDVLPLGSQDNQSDDDEGEDDKDADDMDSDCSDHDHPSTSSSLSSLSRLGAQREGEEEEEEMADVLWVPTGPSCRLGEWEAHTRGIASRLMAKMGYEIGKGLGKNGEGRTEPVEAVIVPAGKSLDTCMKLREMKKLGIVGKKKAKKKGKGKKKKKKGAGGAGTTVKKPRDVFEFINTHLGAKKVKVNELLADNATLVKSQKRPREESKGERIAKSRQINVQLMKTQEEVRATEKRLSHLQQSLARNKGDKAACVTIQAEIAKAEQYLITVRSSEKKLERQKDHRDGHKKLTIF